MGYDMEMDEYHEDKEHENQELRPSFFDKLSKEEKEEFIFSLSFVKCTREFFFHFQCASESYIE